MRAKGRVTYIPLSSAGQLALIFVIGVFGAWIGHASFSYFELRRVIEGKDQEIARAGEQTQKLLARMSDMRSQFSDVAGTLDRNHRDLANLLNQNNALMRELGGVEQNLRTSETGRAPDCRRRLERRQRCHARSRRYKTRWIPGRRLCARSPRRAHW